MPDRDGYIAGVPCWVDTSQPDPDAAAEFYGGLFGWELEDAMPPGSDAKYLMARIRGRNVAAVSSAPEGETVAKWQTYIWVDSADETEAKVRDAGGTVLSEPFDVFGAGRMAVFTDPEGAEFAVWQAGEHKGAGVVNEHGSINFNGLHTRDVEAAKAFYGAVFGWTTLSFSHSHFWTLPGYGDHLEERTPGLRKMTADFGVTPEFVDVVASINPIPDGDDGPARWSVTFGADDADEAARRTTELGGQVIVPPFDAPYSRLTILADPAGATFIASKFVPENKDVGA